MYQHLNEFFSIVHHYNPLEIGFTMGNCFVAPSRQHESLNEYDDRYFDRVQARNSIGSSQHVWWSQTKQPDSFQGLKDERPALEPGATQSTTSPVDSSSGSSPITRDPLLHSEAVSPWKVPQSPYSLALTSPTHPLSIESPDVDDAFSLPFRVDAAWNGWQVKRKGRALRLRLAKNRFLQLASDPSFPKAALSPLSLDSDSTEGNSHDWDTNDFEANGMIWAELTRQVPISAMAMSRSYLDLPLSRATPRPLLMALGDESGMVTVTEIVDGHQSQRRNGSGRKFGESLEFHMQGRIRCIDFAPNDQSILVGGDGCVAVFLLIVVDTVTLELQELRALWQVECVDRIYSVQCDPLGSCLSVAGFDGKIALYSTEGLLQPNPTATTEILRRGLIYCLDWHPSGSSFAVGGSDKICGIYGKDCKLVREVSFSSAVQTLKWNPDGMYLAIAIRGEVAILDGAQFTVKCELSNAPDKSSRYRVEDLCWSPDGSFLAIGGSDGICLVIETKTYALVHEVHRPSQILCLSWGQLVASNECYRYLAISDHDSCVALVKAGIESEGSEVDETVSMASSAYFSTASETNWILREDSFKDMDDCPTELPCDIMPRGTVTAVAFSRASKSKGSSYLAYAADDCSLTIMTTRNWSVVFQMEFAKPVRAMVFSCTNNFLAFGGDEGILFILSVPSRSIVFNTILSAKISTIAFSCHDERLSIGSNDGILTLLSTRMEWAPVGEIDFSDSPVLCQAWSNQSLAVGREDGSVTIFDTEKVFDNFFVPMTELHYTKAVQSLAFGSSGRFLAVGGDFGQSSILDSNGGWLSCHELNFDQGTRLLATSWSPDGRYLIVAGTNKAFRIIDTITWTDVVQVEAVTNKVFDNDLAFSAIANVDWSLDGEWIALGTIGGGIHALGTAMWQLLVPSKDRLALSPVEEQEEVADTVVRGDVILCSGGSDQNITPW